jgi:hypothetical protein
MRDCRKSRQPANLEPELFRRKRADGCFRSSQKF